MKKGRFYRTDNGYEDYFKLSLGFAEEINIPCSWPGYSGYNFKDYVGLEGKIETSDFVNSLCFELLKTFGIEYDEENNVLRKVIYTWDVNLIPGEKFFGIVINRLIGCEGSWVEMFPTIEMGIEVLNRYDFNHGYVGIRKTYPLYLPYTEENIELYKKYIEFDINRNYPNSIRKIKI